MDFVALAIFVAGEGFNGEVKTPSAKTDSATSREYRAYCAKRLPAPLFGFVDPVGYGLPLGVVFGFELAASAMEFVAAAIVRERVDQQLAP